MKSLQLIQSRVFEIVDAPMPKIAGFTDRLLVRSRWFSLCGSDISFFNGNKRCVKYPMPVGAPIHESVGQVVESQSGQFRPGDMVLAIPEGDAGWVSTA